MASSSFFQASDAQLVRRALRGEHRSFEALVSRHQRKAYAIARASGVRGDDLDDVVQQVFLQVFRSLSQLRDTDRFGPWFVAISRNASRGHVNRQSPALCTSLDDFEGKASESLEGRELNELLRQKVSELPNVLRETIFLYYFEGESVKNVARALETTQSAIKMRLQRGRDMLRQAMWRALEGSLRDLVPSRQEWRRKSRALSLLLLATVPSTWSTEGFASSAANAVGVGSTAVGGIFLIAKKAVLSAVAVAFLLAISGAGIFVAVERRADPNNKMAPLSALRDTVSPPAVASRNAAESILTTSPAAAALTQWTSDAPLFGVVVLPHGGPAPGASVLAHLLEDGSLPRIRWDVAPLLTTADPQGRFEVRDIEHGRWTLAASTLEGPRGLIHRTNVPCVDPVRIVLETGNALAGKVTDEDGIEIPGAEITVDSNRPYHEPKIPMRKRELKTMAVENGEFQVRGLPLGEYRVSAEAPGYWGETATVKLPAREAMVLRLKKATYVGGHVFVGNREHPLRSSQLKILTNQPRGWSWQLVTTGPKGEFFSGPFHSGTYLLTFAHEPLRLVTLEVTLTEAAPRNDLEIIFSEGITVRGRALRGEGVALQHAILKWRESGAAAGAFLECVTDSEGRFERTGLEPGIQVVSIDGLIEESRRHTTISLEGVSPIWVEIKFDVPAPVVVRVVDAQAVPVAGAPLGIEYASKGTGYSETALATDAQGRTALVGFPPEGKLELIAGDRNTGTAEVTLDMSDPPEEILLRVEPWGAIAGQVALASAQSLIAGASIRARRNTKYRERTETAEDGTFHIALPPGEWNLEAYSGPLGILRREGIIVKPGEVTDGIHFQFEENSPGSIRGRVLGEDGKPIENAYVSIQAPAKRDFEHRAVLQSDSGGWFATLLPDAKYNITVSKNLARTNVVDVRPGDPPIELRLEVESEGKISGRVVLAGEPVEGAQVKVFTLGNDHRHHVGETVISGPGGQFEFLRVPLSTRKLVVTAQHPQFAMARSKEIELPEAAAVEDVDVLALPGSDLELCVVGPETTAIPGAFVSLTAKSEPPLEAQGVTDATGLWRLRRLPPGEYAVEVKASSQGLCARRAFTWPSEDAEAKLLVPVVRCP